MVDLFEADDLLLVQDLDRIEPQVPSALSCTRDYRSLNGLNAIWNRDITEMDATEATRTEGSMDNKILDGISGLGPSLERGPGRFHAVFTLAPFAQRGSLCGD